jgi:tripartite-type tricarboxylate transporter receptor subunit TctC
MKAAIVCASVVVLSLAAAPDARSQYPAKPIRWVVPFSPGGGTDTLARVMRQRLSDALGQQVIIDNRPGAGANIGAEVVAKAAPDGYTLLMGNVANTINMRLYAKPGYDIVKDFAPINLRVGFEAIGSTPEEFGAYIRSEVEKWTKVVRAAGVRAD